MKRYVAVIYIGNKTIVKERRADNAWEALELISKNLKDNEEEFECSEHPITLPNNSGLAKVRVYELAGEIREFKIKPL